ncbi:MAG: BamA/TamA family outer membrane protein, partial [Bacteroidota bacterium]
GNDIFDDQSVTRSTSRRVHIFDNEKEDNQLLHLSDSKDKRSVHPEYNLYNRKGSHYKPNFLSSWPALAFNPDDKLLLGLLGTYTQYGKRKEPFAARHEFNGTVSLNNSGFRGYYQGDFSEIVGRWGLRFKVLGQTSLYATNFYGLGNYTVNREDEFSLDYHRVRREDFRTDLQLRWSRNQQFSFLVGPRIHRYNVTRRAGTLLDELSDNLSGDLFENLLFVDLNAQLRYSNVDQLTFPTSGLNFELAASHYEQLDGTTFSFLAVNSKLSFYAQLDRTGRLVLGTQVGFQHRFSEDFPFFLAADLSGAGPLANLRGFRRNRFLGQTAFHQNTDLRWKIGTWRNRLMPVAYGLTASFDYGRVWLAEEEMDGLHYSYGGGCFVSPFNLLTIHLGAYHGDGENWRFLAGSKFFF